MDTQIVRVNDGLDIAYDQHQWIVRRRKGVRMDRGEDWQSVKFVTTRPALFTKLMQLGATRDDAETAIRELPTTHAEFMAGRA